MCEFEKHQNLIYQVYNTYYQGFSYLQDDILQCGYIGLWKACETFNKDKNTQFNTYAVACIKNEIKMFLRKERKFRVRTEHNLTSTEMDYLFENQGDINEQEQRDFERLQDAVLKEVKDKDVFMLYSEGYKQKEISKILGLSPTSICRKLHNDINRIKAKHPNGYVKTDAEKVYDEFRREQ